MLYNMLHGMFEWFAPGLKTGSEKTTFNFSALNSNKTHGDGYYLIHAVFTSIHYIGLNRVPTKDTLLNLAYYEVIIHLEYCLSFVSEEDSDLVQGL